MTQKKYQQILETKEGVLSNLKVSIEEQEEFSITIQNSKQLNKGNYLLAEIIRSQTIPSGTAGF
jgi:hypothetical protein